MENEQIYDNGIKIRIEQNSLKFMLPDGKVYYKNLKNFLEGVAKGQKNFFAPLSSEGEMQK